MRPVTAETIRRLDREAGDKFGISGLVLMENAGGGIAKILARDYAPGRVTVLAGKGNNGGDGFVAARFLAAQNFQVDVVFFGAPETLKPDSRANFLKLLDAGLPVRCVAGDLSVEEAVRMVHPGTGLLLDAIFGVGLTRAPEGIYETAIRAINRSEKEVVSVDVPSGLNADSGDVPGVAVKASRTLTLALPKTGLAIGKGPELCGVVEVVDIGIPRELLAPYRG